MREAAKETQLPSDLPREQKKKNAPVRKADGFEDGEFEVPPAERKMAMVLPVTRRSVKKEHRADGNNQGTWMVPQTA